VSAAPKTLPDLEGLDTEALKFLVLALHRQTEAARVEIDNLQLLIAKLKQLHFGAKSERVERQIDQLQLRLEDLEMNQAAEAENPAVAESATPASSAAQAPARRRPRREPLPAHLPRETQTIAPEHADCPECGGKLRPLGEDVSEILEFVPGHFQVIRQVRPKLSCGGCSTIVQAPAPSRPVDRGLAGPGLLAHVLVSKYAYHLPLYRQAEIYSNLGVELERSTLAGWVGGAARTLDPFVEAIRRYVLSGEKVHADDTPVPVLAPGEGKTKTGRAWTYVRDDRGAGSNDPPAVWFTYSPDRKGAHPQAHLQMFRGILQADAYAGFNEIFKQGRVVEAACWAHARRKFHDLSLGAAPSPLGKEAVRRIGQLYEIEREIHGMLPEERLKVRLSRAMPLLDSLGEWLREQLGKFSKKSAGAKAIEYSLGLWPALTRYCGDGRIEIDNNAAERALRAVAVGRENYLFAGSDTGGGDLYADWYGEAERDGPGCVFAVCAGADCRSSDQKDSRVAALELCRERTGAGCVGARSPIGRIWRDWQDGEIGTVTMKQRTIQTVAVLGCIACLALMDLACRSNNIHPASSLMRVSWLLTELTKLQQSCLARQGSACSLRELQITSGPWGHAEVVSSTGIRFLNQRF
jgi:transposase